MVTNAVSVDDDLIFVANGAGGVFIVQAAERIADALETLRG